MPQHIDDDIEDRAGSDGLFAIAYALLRIADAQRAVGTHLKYLGNGDAATTMGAIEGLAAHIGEKLDRLADELHRED